MRPSSSPFLLLSGLLTLGVAARAEKVGVQVTPASATAAGFAVTVAPREGGTLRFTIVRDATKADWPARDAWLDVRGGGTLLATCPLKESRPTKPKLVAYSFDMSREAAEGSALTVTEVQTADGKPDGEKILGGGTFYHFRLADFIQQSAQKLTAGTRR
ncbi:MAG TPA: hypothetical protein VKT77_01860 [Chthonomonadaceae bacterium]|nr:hypothetical protein [Chthonomonadaceae bacterium]